MSDPSLLGYHMPAEWKLHDATWIAWPHKRTDWPGKFAPIPWVYGEIIRKIALGERVVLVVNSERDKARSRHILKRIGVDLAQIAWFQIGTDRGWSRDVGPIFLTKRSPSKNSADADKIAVVEFAFSGWGKYEDWKQDAKVSREAARHFGFDSFEATINELPFVLEGGSIDVNGAGTVLTTEECLLDQYTQSRNPGASRTDVESALVRYLGVEQVVWLGKGIIGDDTHGHVDDICRFVNSNTVVLATETNPADGNYNLLAENRERLEGVQLSTGTTLNVIDLPMPNALYCDGQRVPASYANFYISNFHVLVPTFNDAKDRIALGILSELFPSREVVGIHAVDLVWGLGTIHCLTQQQPSR